MTIITRVPLSFHYILIIIANVLKIRTNMFVYLAASRQIILKQYCHNLLVKIMNKD